MKFTRFASAINGYDESPPHQPLQFRTRSTAEVDHCLDFYVKFFTRVMQTARCGVFFPTSMTVALFDSGSSIGKGRNSTGLAIT